MLGLALRQFDLEMKRRKGLDKPVFLIASITLAIMFLVVYYTATSGWIEELGTQFNDVVDQNTPSAAE